MVNVMPGSKHWSDPEEDMYEDDNGNVVYYDRTGKLRKYRKNDAEFQQMYHYEDD